MNNTLTKELLRDRIAGSLMAGAAGDALGYAVEFISRNAILSNYGPEGITTFDLARNGKALISDDTQMTLFTAASLLTSITQSAIKGETCPPESYVKQGYIDWYFTQTGIDTGKKHTWLRDLPELAHRRAPGTTCMSACHSIINNETPQNYSKGCGGIMRVAPLALLYASAQVNQISCGYTMESLAMAGAQIAKETHLHPLGYLPAAIMAALLAQVMLLSPQEIKDSLDNIIDNSINAMMTVEGDENMSDKEVLKGLTLNALKLARDHTTPPHVAIAQLGEGWTGEEAWAISIYCAARFIDSTPQAIIAAVNHNGDSDSTGAITGNIMGAIYGKNAIKEENMFCPEGKNFEDTLELHNIIMALANDLACCCPLPAANEISTPKQQQWVDRYVNMIPAGL